MKFGPCLDDDSCASLCETKEISDHTTMALFFFFLGEGRLLLK